MLDIADSHGLVCGYMVAEDGQLTPVELGDADAALSAQNALVWLHFDLADARARRWIEACDLLPPPARAMLLATDGHMRIETTAGGLCGAVGDLHHDFGQNPDQLDVLRLYLDNRLLISGRRRPLTAIDKLRTAIGEGLKVERPIALVTHFLQHVTDTLGDLIMELSDGVDRVEEALLDEGALHSGAELGRVRRQAARLRRHMVPQQHALLGLLSRLPQWIDDVDAAKLRTAIERLGALGHDLDLVQERAALVHEQAAARLAETTNRNLYMLSIVTTVFLPMSLITGIFGMNLGGLPAQQNPNGFWYGLLFMIVTAAGALVLLRKGRML